MNKYKCLIFFFLGLEDFAMRNCNAWDKLKRNTEYGKVSEQYDNRFEQLVDCEKNTDLIVGKFKIGN